MPSSFFTTNISKPYTTAIDALCEIAHTSFFRGTFDHALHVLSASLRLIEGGEVAQKDQLKLLLLYGKVLIVHHLLFRGESTLMFSTIFQAQQLAAAIEDQQALADALGLLGEAHCNATTVEIIQRGGLPFGTQGQGKYEEALSYQQQALRLREALHDTRGMSESLFCIGLIYQFWQQHELAREHFLHALEIAETAGHVLEQAEPQRHLTIDALFKGDLEGALSHAKRALSSREAAGFRPYQPLDHLTLRDIYQKLGDTARAQFHLQQASTLATELGLFTLVSSTISVTDATAYSKEQNERA